ncbi:MAG: hypothetical protein ACOX9E_07300 [Lentisphaeria bacterium]
MDTMDTMDDNTCLPAVHTVHTVHSRGHSAASRSLDAVCEVMSRCGLQTRSTAGKQTLSW